jgi:hypothetical protein
MGGRLGGARPRRHWRRAGGSSAGDGRAASTAQGLRTPSVFAPAPLGAQHARTDIGAVHSLQRGVDGLLILGERTGSQQRNDLNISLPSHCYPTPCIQASITSTLEAVTVAHQRGFWRRGRPVAILGVGHIKSVGRNRDIVGGGMDPLVTAHDVAAAQHGADHLGGKVLGVRRRSRAASMSQARWRRYGWRAPIGIPARIIRA